MRRVYKLLFPYIQQFKITIGPFVNINPLWCLESVVLIGFLIWLNIRGVCESSFLNEMFGVIEILSESALIIMGFVFAWKPEFLFISGQKEIPTMHNFMYGSSLAIISFVGLESISQAAQETRRPATIIPHISITLIFSVFIFAIAFSTLGLGMLPWQTIAAHEGDPLAVLGTAIPYIGYIAGSICSNFECNNAFNFG